MYFRLKDFKPNNEKQIVCLITHELYIFVSWFYGISKFMGYLIPIILLDELMWYNFIHEWGHTILNSIRPKVNIISWMKFETSYDHFVEKYFSPCATLAPQLLISIEQKDILRVY